jgi:hypothetical protein
MPQPTSTATSKARLDSFLESVRTVENVVKSTAAPAPKK